MKFTKEEISLCKQVAEKHRKDIEYGDWYHFKGDEVYKGGNYVYAPEGTHLSEDEIKNGNIIPLWTISDCLEFLKGKKWKVVEFREDWIGGFWVLDLDRQDTKHEPLHLVGKTTLEACLKTVLAVLEEQGK